LYIRIARIVGQAMVEGKYSTIAKLPAKDYIGIKGDLFQYAERWQKGPFKSRFSYSWARRQLILIGVKSYKGAISNRYTKAELAELSTRFLYRYDTLLRSGVYPLANIIQADQTGFDRAPLPPSYRQVKGGPRRRHQKLVGGNEKATAMLGIKPNGDMLDPMIVLTKGSKSDDFHVKKFTYNGYVEDLSEFRAHTLPKQMVAKTVSTAPALEWNTANIKGSRKAARKRANNFATSPTQDSQASSQNAQDDDAESPSSENPATPQNVDESDSKPSELDAYEDEYGDADICHCTYPCDVSLWVSLDGTIRGLQEDTEVVYRDDLLCAEEYSIWYDHVKSSKRNVSGDANPWLRIGSSELKAVTQALAKHRFSAHFATLPLSSDDSEPPSKKAKKAPVSYEDFVASITRDDTSSKATKVGAGRNTFWNTITSRKAIETPWQDLGLEIMPNVDEEIKNLLEKSGASDSSVKACRNIFFGSYNHRSYTRDFLLKEWIIHCVIPSCERKTYPPRH
jgi:hypothetical protein